MEGIIRLAAGRSVALARRSAHWRQMSARVRSRTGATQTLAQRADHPERLPAPRAYATSGELSPQQSNQADRYYASFTVYKGKAAMSMNPIKPTWIPVDAPNSELRAMRRARTGALFLEFAPSVGQMGSPGGGTAYDWSRKVTFALSPTELGDLVELHPGESLSFTHDPGAGTAASGQVYKTLAITPMEKSGYFFSLSVKEAGAAAPTRMSVPVAVGEMGVVRSVARYLIPRLLGLDEALGAPDGGAANGAGGAYDVPGGPSPPGGYYQY
ncbi:unnamed protein product [Pedinophyceae sp. YPF-701]|nr:unnamed protein product [Pedinophyceae sp. YPF-701]